MAASSDASDGLQQPPPLLMQHMQQQQQPGGGGQMAAMTTMGSPYYDHQQQFNMGPHSAPPVQKQHMPSFDNPLRKMERMTQEPGLFEPPNKLPRLSSPKEPNAMFMALGPSKCGSKASAAPSQQQSQMLAAPPQNGQQQPTSLDDNLTPEARRSREQKLEKLKAMERFLPSDPTMQQMGVSRPMMMNNGPPPHGMYPCPPQQQMQHMYRPHPQQNVLVAMNPSNAPGSRRSPSMDPNQADHQAAWDRMVHDYEMEKMKGMNAGQDMVQDPPMNDMFMAQRSKPVGMVPPNARTAHQHQQQRFGHPQMYPGGPLDGQFGNPPHQRMMGPPPGGAGYPRPMDPRFMSPHHPGVYYAPHPGGPAPPQMFPGDPADPYGMHPGKPSMMAGHNEMVGVYGGMGGANGPPPPRHYQPGMAQGPQQPHQPHQQQHQQPTVNNTFINAHVSMPQVNIQNIVPGPGQLGTMTVQQMTMHQHQQQQQQSMRPQGPIPMGAPMPPGSHAVMRPAQGGPGGQPPMYDYGPNGGSQDYSNCWPEPLTNLDSKVPSQKVQYYPATKQDPPPEFVGGFQGSMMTAQQIIKTDGQKVCMQQQANYASVSSSQQPPQQMQPHYDFQHQMYGQPAVRR
uniref:Uncharacterized protein n=1 Tax=Plectus sambesii TaxID=2011161 RepID=A0A914VZ06_9BILA